MTRKLRLSLGFDSNASWQKSFTLKIPKRRKYEPRILYLAKLSGRKSTEKLLSTFNNGGKIVPMDPRNLLGSKLQPTEND